MSREDNIFVFKDTERLCESNERLAASVKAATEGQRLILETDDVPSQKRDLHESAAKVVVSKKRTFEAAEAFKGMKTAVLNFASATTPGGGVVTGSNAQEESLCRCSGLYFSLNTPAMNSGFYEPHFAEHNPLHNDDIIYTPSVTVFKSDTAMPELRPADEWFDVDVITCAAPNLRIDPSNSYNMGDGDVHVEISDEDLQALHEKRLKRILEVALLNGAEAVVLGAFGCGAFANNPEVVARANYNVIGDYLHAFKVIEFAVYCSPRDDSNYRVFDRVLGR